MSEQITLADGGVLDVGRWPLPEGLTDGVLNRAQLAVAFSTSENTISKWIGQGMPVQSSGQNGTSYELRLSHCYAWRMDREEAARSEKAQRDSLAQQAAFAFRNLDDDAAEEDHLLSAREYREWSEAELKKLQADEARGRLVRAERVQRVFEDILVKVRSNVNTMPDFAEREFGLTAQQVAKFQTRCDDLLSDLRDQIGREVLVSGQIVELSDDDRQDALEL